MCVSEADKLSQFPQRSSWAPCPHPTESRLQSSLCPSLSSGNTILHVQGQVSRSRCTVSTSRALTSPPPADPCPVSLTTLQNRALGSSAWSLLPRILSPRDQELPSLPTLDARMQDPQGGALMSSGCSPGLQLQLGRCPRARLPSGADLGGEV